jgi:hypothetical protein
MRVLLALICWAFLSSPVSFFQADAAQRNPLIYWPHGIDTAPSLKRAGIEEICVPPDKAKDWRAAGFKPVPMTVAELERREKLLVPGIIRRGNVASPTTRPWIDANGWRFVRKPAGRFYYDLPRGKAALAAAEAFVYRADAILKIDQADLEEVGKMLLFLRGLPQDILPEIADIAVIDDGTPATGEVMNLLSRRNLLFKVVSAPSPQIPINIKLGSKEYPQSETADPSAFAQKIRRTLTDDRRTIRIYGNEVVICRVVGDSTRTRVHVLNYSGRQIDSMHLRLRGNYGKAVARVFGDGEVSPENFVVAEGATELTIPRMGSYAVIELPTKR